jgi:hypothetical protein
MFMLLQKLTFDDKRQICLSTLSKLTTGNAFRLQWYQNHSNFHCYQQTQSFLITLYIFNYVGLIITREILILSTKYCFCGLIGLGNF